MLPRGKILTQSLELSLEIGYRILLHVDFDTKSSVDIAEGTKFRLTIFFGSLQLRILVDKLFASAAFPGKVDILLRQLGGLFVELTLQA